jgi:NAD(P)-dependent dehydrogenase (short-subunit alcohol dehydrogenase family)
MFRGDLLAGKRILVTGGGSGLGAAMTRRYAELGATVHIAGRRLEVLQDTAGAIARDLGQVVHPHRCDVRDPESVERTLDAIWAQGSLDVLVNNAAATFVARTEQLSPRAVDAILGPTLHGAIHGTLGAGRRWIASGHRGVVLSILSTSTITGRAFTVPSAIARARPVRARATRWAALASMSSSPTSRPSS